MAFDKPAHNLLARLVELLGGEITVQSAGVSGSGQKG
jgi:hypothetical protein